MESHQEKKSHYKAVFAVFEERGALELAITELKKSGFRKSDLTILLKEENATKAFAHKKNTQTLEDTGLEASTGIVGGLVSMGIPSFEAERFNSVIQDGGMLISVHVDDEAWSNTAKVLLRDCGTRDISIATEESGEWQFLSDDPSASNGYYRAPLYNSTVDLERH